MAIFGENSAHWLFADQGIQIAGAATVVRGTDAPVDELKFIYDHPDAREVVGEMPSISVLDCSSQSTIVFANHRT